jgi:hypothetical protein
VNEAASASDEPARRQADGMDDGFIGARSGKCRGKSGRLRLQVAPSGALTHKNSNRISHYDT